MKHTWIRDVLLLACGVALGLTIPAMSAQQREGRRGPAPLTLDQLPAEVAALKALVPSNSHIMMDVQWHWTNLWFAGRKKNWPLAQFYFNETRGHIQWLIRKSPIIRSQIDNKDVDVAGIFDGVDTSSLAAVKTAIESKDSVQFAAAYRTMTESCYACHKSVGRPYLRPQIPTAQVQAVVNMDPGATWPQ